MARTLSQEITAMPTAITPSRSSATRQTLRSRCVSRSRSEGAEVESAETSTRDLGIFVISFDRKVPPAHWGIREVNLA
jgi:hypothetical protein